MVTKAAAVAWPRLAPDPALLPVPLTPVDKLGPAEPVTSQTKLPHHIGQSNTVPIRKSRPVIIWLHEQLAVLHYYTSAI